MIIIATIMKNHSLESQLENKYRLMNTVNCPVSNANNWSSPSNTPKAFGGQLPTSFVELEQKANIAYDKLKEKYNKKGGIPSFFSFDSFMGYCAWKVWKYKGENLNTIQDKNLFAISAVVHNKNVEAGYKLMGKTIKQTKLLVEQLNPIINKTNQSALNEDDRNLINTLIEEHKQICTLLKINSTQITQLHTLVLDNLTEASANLVTFPLPENRQLSGG